MESLTEGGKARRILFHPDSFMDHDFQLLSVQKLADLLGVTRSQVYIYQKDFSKVPKKRIKQLADLFDEYRDGWAGDEGDQDTEDDLREKTHELLFYPNNFLDYQFHPLTLEGLARQLGLSRFSLLSYRKSPDRIPKKRLKQFGALYNNLFKTSDLPKIDTDDYITLLKALKNQDELFEDAQKEIQSVILNGLSNVEVSPYTRQLLTALIDGVMEKDSTLLRAVIMRMSNDKENNR